MWFSHNFFTIKLFSWLKCNFLCKFSVKIINFFVRPRKFSIKSYLNLIFLSIGKFSQPFAVHILRNAVFELYDLCPPKTAKTNKQSKKQNICSKKKNQQTSPHISGIARAADKEKKKKKTSRRVFSFVDLEWRNRFFVNVAAASQFRSSSRWTIK